MVDPWGFMKNVLDAHGAWILGGAIVANLAHTANKKSKGFKRAAEWDYVTCVGCGRGGYSDEMRSGRDASGKDHYSCARCSRPDLFKQAEGVDYSTTVYRVRFQDLNPGAINREGGMTSLLDTDDPVDYHYRTAERAMEHINVILNDWSYYDWQELAPRGKRRTWKSGKADMKLMFTPVKLSNVVREAEGDGSDVDNDLPAIGSRWRQRMWMNGPYDWEKHSYKSGKYAPNRMTNNVLEILAHHTSIDPNDPQIVAFWVQVGGSSRYRIGEITVLGLDNLKHIYREEPGSVGRTAEEDSSKPCSHCDGTASFPREFYYQTDRIEMVPCGTCITQGRCPGCMEIYPNLSRDNTPEDVFLGSGCVRCGYTEADARAARKTARRWADLVDNPAAAKFMAEGDDDDYIECEGCSNSVSFARVMDVLGWRSDGYCDQCVEEHMEAEGDDEMEDDFYVHSADEIYGPYDSLADAEDAVDRLSDKGIEIRGITRGKSEYMEAESYDPGTHGKTLPLGSVKRFLTTIPRGQMFHVEFVKSNGDIRPMDAFFNKPYQPDSNTANVMEVTGSGKASFKRFRVDRVVSIYRI